MPKVSNKLGLMVATSSPARQTNSRRRADVAVPRRFFNRPSAVRTAIYQVWEHSGACGFTRAATRVLQAIIATGVSSESPFTPVFAKKATLAKLADCSEITVYRALKSLECAGWIKRNHQERMDDGLMDIGLITITEKLAILVGLIDEVSGLIDDLVARDERSTSAQADPAPNALLPAVENLSPLRPSDSLPIEEPPPPFAASENRGDCPEMKDGMMDGPIYRGERLVYPNASVNYQSTVSKFVRMDGRSVAVELVWLINEKRLTYQQLFKLQKLAKQVPGQQLSDFVAYRSERIKQLSTNNDCYRYIKSFIDEGIDARYLVGQRAKTEHQAHRRSQRNEAAEKRQAWIKAHGDMTFISSKTQATYRVNAAHGLLEVGENGMPTNKPSIKITSRFIQAVESGNLVRFVRQEAPRDIELGSKRLSEIANKFPGLIRRKAMSAAIVAE